MSHNKELNKEYEYITPLPIIRSLGDFDLDPAAPIIRPWDMAKHHYDVIDDGLLCKWHGRVWCNPPYGKQIALWASLMADHGNGIMLIPSRTGSPWFHEQIYQKADSIFYMKDRIWFCDKWGIQAKGNAGHDSVLVSYHPRNIDAVMDSGIPGHLDRLRTISVIIINVSPSWVSVVSRSITRLGGKAVLADIYSEIEVIAPDKIKKNGNWKEKVRQKLQFHFIRVSRGQYTNTVA